MVDARERFEKARMDAVIARVFDGPSKNPPAKVISLADRRAKKA